jgi:hypothetical protein
VWVNSTETRQVHKVSKPTNLLRNQNIHPPVHPAFLLDLADRNLANFTGAGDVGASSGL